MKCTRRKAIGDHRGTHLPSMNARNQQRDLEVMKLQTKREFVTKIRDTLGDCEPYASTNIRELANLNVQSAQMRWKMF